jgi:hypothetical protein
MESIRKILQSKSKPKEKTAKIVKNILENEISIKDLFKLFESGNDVEKGTYAEVMKFVSKEKPELFKSYFKVLNDHINYDASRVKWGVPETIGNLAEKYPKETAKSIPNLMKNTKDKSTVVRWCAAYALTNIARHNKNKQKSLVRNFKTILKKEKNKGVKNVYLDILKHH